MSSGYSPYQSSSPAAVEISVSVVVYSDGGCETYEMRDVVARDLRNDFLKYMGVLSGVQIQGGAYPYDDGKEVVVQFRLVERIEFDRRLG